MTIIFKKKYRTCLFALIPLFLLSNAGFNEKKQEHLRDNLSGIGYDAYFSTRFNTAMETTYDGTIFSILKLHVENENEALEQDMQFVISRKKNMGGIGPGAYKVAKDKDGLLNHIDGVFGVLDNKKSGDLPFFAHFGEITLAKVDEEVVNGYMNIHFKNTSGHSLHVKGSFTSLPR